MSTLFYHKTYLVFYTARLFIIRAFNKLNNFQVKPLFGIFILQSWKKGWRQIDETKQKIIFYGKFYS